MSKRQLLLISSSKVSGYDYLEHPKTYIDSFLKKNNVHKILFVPFALNNHDGYTSKISNVLNSWGYSVKGIHTQSNPVDAIKTAESIFIGGGNTFLLLKSLYENNLIDVIRDRVLNNGVPYIGISAGTNVATKNIRTTNDMPIVYPPSFDALNLVPFNINPHYLDVDPNTKHQGETREERILQFLEVNESPVLGLREGCALQVSGNAAKLVGTKNSRLYMNGDIVEHKPESDLSFLLK